MELSSPNNKLKSVNEWISEVDSKLNSILDDFLTKSQVATQLNTGAQINKSDTNKTSDFVKSKKLKRKLSESLTPTSAILQRDQGLQGIDRDGRKGEGTGKNASTYATFHDGETLVDIVDSDIEITSKKKRKIEKCVPNSSSVSSKKKKKRNNVKEGSVTSADSVLDHKEDGELFFFDMSGSGKNGNSVPTKESHAPIGNKNTVIDMVDSEVELTYSKRKTKKNKTQRGYESNRDPPRKKKKKSKENRQSTKIDEDSQNNNTVIDMVESEIELTYSDRRSNENKTLNGYENNLDFYMRTKKKSKQNDQSTKIDEDTNHYCSTSSELTDSFQLGQQVSPRKKNKSKWKEKTEDIDLSQKTPKKKKKKDKSEKYTEESHSSFVIPEMGTNKKKKVKNKDDIDNSNLVEEPSQETQIEEDVNSFKSSSSKEKSKKKKNKEEQDPVQYIKELFEKHSLDHSKLFGETIEKTEFEENIPNHNLPSSIEKSKKKNRDPKPQVEENAMFKSPNPKEKSKKKKINGEDPLNYIEEDSLDHAKLLGESIELTELEENVLDHNLPGSKEKSKKKNRDLKKQVEENAMFKSPNPKEKSKKKKINEEDPLNYIEEHSLHHSKLLGESIEKTELEENVSDHNLPGSKEKSKKKNRDLKPQVEENAIKSPNPKEKSKKKKINEEDPLNYIEEHSLHHSKLLGESIEKTELEENVSDHNLPGSKEKSKKKNRDLKPQVEENAIKSPNPKEKSKKKKINREEDPLNYIEEHSIDHSKLLGESVELTELEENVPNHNLPALIEKSKKKNRDLKPQVEDNIMFKSPSPKEKSKKKKINGEDPLNYEEHFLDHLKLLGESIEKTELEKNVPNHNLPGSNEKSKKKSRDIKQDEDSLEYIKELFREHEERSSTHQTYFEILSGVKEKKKKKSKERISEDSDSQIHNESFHINDNIEGENNYQIENEKSQISYQTFEEYLNYDELVERNLNVNENSATKLKKKSKLSPDSKLEKLNNLSANNSNQVKITEDTQVVEEILITPDLFDDSIDIREGQILENVNDSILNEFVKKRKKSKIKEDVESTSFEESPDTDSTLHRKRKKKLNTSESSETTEISKTKKTKKSLEANGKRKLMFDYLTLHNNASVDNEPTKEVKSKKSDIGIDNEQPDSTKPEKVKSKKNNDTSMDDKPTKKVKSKKNNDTSIDNEHTGKAKSKKDDTSDTSIEDKPVEKIKSKKNERKSKEKENSPVKLKQLLNKTKKIKKENSSLSDIKEDIKFDNSTNTSVEDLPEPRKKNETLEIKLPTGYKVPPLHRMKIASKPTEEELKLARSLGKSGAFGQEEDAVIIRNWKSFCKSHNLPEDPTMFLRLSNIDMKKRKTFLQFLSQGLEKRLPLRVYGRFKKMYDRVQKKQGRYTKLEDEKLLEFMATTESRKPHHDCGILLNRTAASVEKRYYHLISPENKTPLKWDGELSEKLIQVMLEVAETDNVKVLKSMEFTKSQWNAVSSLLGGIPVKKIERAWKVNIYPRLFSREDREYMKRTLIAKLLENGENDFRTIVWKNYSKLFRGVTPRMMGDMFRIMMTHVPKQYKSNLKVILEYLNSHYQDMHFKCRNPTRQIRYKFKNGRLIQNVIKGERL